MKMRNTATLLVIMLVIVISGYVALNGIQLGHIAIESVQDSMKLGLDIEGGVVVVYEAETDLTGTDLDQLMTQTISVISRRINALGLTEPNISRQGDKRIRIELPGVKDSQEAVKVIGQTAQLEFVRVNNDSFAMTGMTREMFEGESVLTGSNVVNASLASDEYGKPAVGLEFDTDGTLAFNDHTKIIVETYVAQESGFINSNGKGQIAILLDNEVISAPMVQVIINERDSIISGDFSVEEASLLASLIRGGALPVNLDEVQTSLIGATLGLDSLNASINAAAVGLALVFAFMLLYYRVPGMFAGIALIFYSILLLFTMIAFDATLTLPGVAGIVLSLGMAVDANVIIFERIKEELRNDKTLRASIDAGFKRAMTTIIDANTTTFIAAIILYMFGEGPIKGFSITLMIGIVISMFTAIVITRSLLKSSIGLGLSGNKKLYGA